MAIRLRMILRGAAATAIALPAFAQGSLGSGQRRQPTGGAGLDQMIQMERQDFGVLPTTLLHTGPMHAPTPASIPGGQVVTTKDLVALIQGNRVPYLLFDVLGQTGMLPNAIAAAWLAQPGSFNDQIQQQFSQMLGQRTQGRKDVPLVLECRPLRTRMEPARRWSCR